MITDRQMTPLRTSTDLKSPLPLTLRLISAFWLSLSLSCCEEGNSEEESSAPVEVEISFEVRVGELPFQCGETFEEVGASASSLTFTDLRFFVHDLSLINSNGDLTPLVLTEDDVWQRDQVALLDFEDGCENGNGVLNTSVKGVLPAGSYEGVQFSVGVPAALNSPETALEGRGSPLNLSAMFWSWRSGYKYLRLDTDLSSFRIHLGANACESDFVCAEPNIATFTLEGYQADRDLISLDLKTLLQDSDLTENTEGTAPGCMGQSDDPDCVGIFNHFNLGEEGFPSAFKVRAR